MGTDAVYIVRPGEVNNELRYSLRSLQNVPHGDVWIFGHRPDWCVNVRHVFVPQFDPGLRKYENNTMLIEAIAESGPPKFALMNDDFFCVRPELGWPAPAHRGPLLELAQTRPGAYGMMLRSTGALLAEAGIADPLAYTLHEPLLIEREGLATALTFGLRHREPNTRVSWRSLYGNMAQLGGERLDDVKVVDDRPPGRRPWVSTSDASFRYMRVGDVIRRALPSPSPYERL